MFNFKFQDDSENKFQVTWELPKSSSFTALLGLTRWQGTGFQGQFSFEYVTYE